MNEQSKDAIDLTAVHGFSFVAVIKISCFYKALRLLSLEI